jgi:hypothetical protein
MLQGKRKVNMQVVGYCINAAVFLIRVLLIRGPQDYGMIIKHHSAYLMPFRS